MYLYILIDKDWNVYTDEEAQIKIIENKYGYRYISADYKGRFYFIRTHCKWYCYHRIPDKVLSFLFLSHPDLYTQVTKAFDL